LLLTDPTGSCASPAGVAFTASSPDHAWTSDLFLRTPGEPADFRFTARGRIMDMAFSASGDAFAVVDVQEPASGVDSVIEIVRLGTGGAPRQSFRLESTWGSPNWIELGHDGMLYVAARDGVRHNTGALLRVDPATGEAVQVANTSLGVRSSPEPAGYSCTRGTAGRPLSTLTDRARRSGCRAKQRTLRRCRPGTAFCMSCSGPAAPTPLQAGAA
jgi:hypothetical protein